ncbi:hypothetical protein K491DRAFT_144172 [Lophiostoma macrostomum CBS 122681]|uniref:Uncharacterized protein n=1 Tax=Lophiostoma macrostomum CBS 122681 TaxID=1314788 RepID=A0A6A6SRK6_9PLEO|nr:hypothetical protein K491DRAFT_144172 [Lophiostoma macrostomum CBS 122681]
MLLYVRMDGYSVGNPCGINPKTEAPRQGDQPWPRPGTVGRVLLVSVSEGSWSGRGAAPGAAARWACIAERYAGGGDDGCAKCRGLTSTISRRQAVALCLRERARRPPVASSSLAARPWRAMLLMLMMRAGWSRARSAAGQVSHLPWTTGRLMEELTLPLIEAIYSLRQERGEGLALAPIRTDGLTLALAPWPRPPSPMSPCPVRPYSQSADGLPMPWLSHSNLRLAPPPTFRAKCPYLEVAAKHRRWRASA